MSENAAEGELRPEARLARRNAGRGRDLTLPFLVRDQRGLGKSVLVELVLMLRTLRKPWQGKACDTLW